MAKKRYNTSPELAFDACDYFTDDFNNFNLELGKIREFFSENSLILMVFRCEGESKT